MLCGKIKKAAGGTHYHHRSYCNFFVIGIVTATGDSSTDSSTPTVEAGASDTDESTPAADTSTESVSQEYKNALSKAETYSDMMYMSKAAIYDQLTSEYGEGFSADAAQYAIDNVKADWKANALKKRKHIIKTCLCPSPQFTTS